MKRHNENDIPNRGCLFGLALCLILWLLMVMAFCGVAMADDRPEKMLLLTAYAGIDYGQSCKVFYRDGHFTQGHELNPILGKTPTRRDMITFGVVGMATMMVALVVLPEAWGDFLLDSALTTEGINIEANALLIDRGRSSRTAMPIVFTWRF